jgi:uncharacterized protein (TIGR02145 family)
LEGKRLKNFLIAMKKITTSSLIILLLFITSINSRIYAQWQQDSKYGFKINVPSNWSKNSYMDGTDKVFDYMSPDENAAVQLRVFDAGIDFTTDLLAQVYEESMLPAGTQKLSLNEYTTVNGIPCKKGVYLLDYNGNEVGLSAIYIVQNNKGYVLTALIPSSMIQQKGEELKGVTNSFSIDGFQASSNTAKLDKKPSGLGGLMGGTSSNNNQQKNDNNQNNSEGNSSGTSSKGISSFVYEGQTYRTVQIGNQVWMAENLNVGTMVTKENNSQDNGEIEKFCFFDDPENCRKFGGFYQWEEMMQYKNLRHDPNNPVVTQGICPSGWHIPTDDEWKILEGRVDSKFGVGDPEWDKQQGIRGSDVGLKLRSKTGWYDYDNGTDNNGTDNYGFTILPTGSGSRRQPHMPRSFGGNDMWGHFWTATPVGPYGGTFSINRSFNYSQSGSQRHDASVRVSAFSIRCIKN